MASKWHFNDFRHVPCRQVLGQALMTKHAQCSPTNLKETTLWQGHFCQVHVSNCKETDSFGAITSIGHQNAKDLKLMGLPNEKSKHVSTAIMYTMSEIETCIFTLPIEGTWWNMAKDETSTSQLLGTEPLANKKPGEHQWFSMFNATSTKQLVQWHLTHG